MANKMSVRKKGSSKKRDEEYYKKSSYHPVSWNLAEAVMMLNDYKRRALDIGSGSFKDSKFLVNCGFIVKAIDKNLLVLRYADWNPFLPKIVFSIEVKDVLKARLRNNHYDLINCQNCLSLNSKSDVQKIIARVRKWLKKDGLFLGNFYGVNDDWAKRPRKNPQFYYTKEEVEKCLRHFKILRLNEKEGDNKNDGDSETVDDKKKHWHLINFTVRK